MICDGCHHENPEGARFCNECGAPLKRKCAGCGTENPERAKFCGECGHPLAGAPPPAEAATVKMTTEEVAAAMRATVEDAPAAERRQLTVMFCDLANSTQISQVLDPEDLRELVRSYQEACAQVVERFGGTIAQYLGDGILAYFGYPTAHEEDAQRAVRAGLGILDAIRDLSESLKERESADVAVRIGIHTGRVVVGEMGGGSKREQLALGDTPNIAARLQGLAELNSIAISPATYQLTHGFFDTQPMGQHTLKGVAKPMEVRSVVGESGVRHRLEVDEHGRTPYIGRESELASLLQAWNSVEGGRGQVVLVTGEGGIGKSRLVRVFKEQAAPGAGSLQESFCSPYFGNTALHPILELVRTSVGLTREDSNKERLHKLRGYLADTKMDKVEALPLLASALAIPPDAGYLPPNLSPQAQRQRTLEVLSSILLRSSPLEPGLVIVEDLHWMDPSTLDLLGLLIQRVSDHSVMLLLTARPGFESPWADVDDLATIALGNLPSGDIESLIAGVTGGLKIPDEVLSMLVAKTDGIPLYVEEMTKMILEAGVLKVVGDHYEVTESLPEGAIPTTLHDSLMARLDRMEGGAKKVAQLGACIGREFSFNLSKAVLRGKEEGLKESLGTLVEAELLFAGEGDTEDRFTFKHALIQDAAYESLLKRTRQEYHERIALALEHDFPEMRETQPERLAEHYTRAARPDKAIPYWLTAGQRAVATSANREASHHLKEGLKLIEALPPSVERSRQEVDFLSTLGTALSALQGYSSSEVQKTYARARELCEEIGATPQHFWVLWGLWAFHLVRGEHDQAVTFGETMMELGRREDDLSLQLEAHFALGLSFFFMGNLGPAREHLERAVAIYEPEKHHKNAYLTIQDVGVTSHSVAALCLWHLGETDLAMERSRQALELADELKHPFSKAYALGCAAWFNLYLRNPEKAQQHAREAIELSTEQGFIWWQIWGTVLGGRALADVGKPADSVAQMTAGIDGWRLTGSGFTIPYFLSLLSEAQAADGNADESLRLLAEARGLLEASGEGCFHAETFRLEGELRLTASKDDAAAEACFGKALEVARTQGARAFELRAALSLARLQREHGQAEEARKLLAERLRPLRGRVRNGRSHRGPRSTGHVAGLRSRERAQEEGPIRPAPPRLAAETRPSRGVRQRGGVCQTAAGDRSEAEMKITNVEGLYLRLPEVKARTDSSQDALIVKISTDAGITGWGEVDASPWVARAIIDAPPSHTLASGLRHLLVGEDPLDIDRLWGRMYEGTLYFGREGAVIQAMAGVDLALWDIKGKALKKPVYQLLEGGYRTSLRVYASNMFQPTPEATAERARAARDAGYTAVKFGWEPFGEDPARDCAYLEADPPRDRRGDGAHARRGPRLGRPDDPRARAPVRALRPLLDRGAAPPRRSRRVRGGVREVRGSDRRRRGGVHGGRLQPAHGAGRRRRGSGGPEPRGPDPGDDHRDARPDPRDSHREPQLHHRHQRGGVAAPAGERAERLRHGVLRGAERPLPLPRPQPDRHRRRLRQRARGARPRRRAGPRGHREVPGPLIRRRGARRCAWISKSSAELVADLDDPGHRGRRDAEAAQAEAPPLRSRSSGLPGGAPPGGSPRCGGPP